MTPSNRRTPSAHHPVIPVVAGWEPQPIHEGRVIRVIVNGVEQVGTVTSVGGALAPWTGLYLPDEDRYIEVILEPSQ